MLLLSGMLVFAAEAPASASARGTTILINETFDSVTEPNLPAGWTVENSNGDDQTWGTYSPKFHQGGQSMAIEWNTILPMDDWLFTPAVDFVAGANYRLTFYVSVFDSTRPEAMEVYYGNSASSAAMTDFIVFISSDIEDWIQIEVGIVPTSSGIHYIGFHGISPANRDTLLIDTLKLEGAACFATHDNGTTVFNTFDATAVQDAIDAAPAGGTVKVAGTCEGVSTKLGTAMQTAYIDKSLTLQGGHTPVDWSLAPDSDLYPTILNAAGLGRGIVLHNPNTLNPRPSVALKHLTIREGVADNTLFTGFLEGGGLLITNQFDVTVVNSLLNVNSAPEPDNSFGGGGIANRGVLRVENSRITGNSAEKSGGGIINHNHMTIVESTVAGNDAVFGGGISNRATMTVIRSTLHDNDATEGGGIDTFGTATIENTTFVGNSAVNVAGGLYNGGSLTMVNSTVAQNTSVRAAGVFNFGNPANATIRNSIIAFGLSSIDCENANDGAISFAHTLVEDGSCGVSSGPDGNLTGSPSLVTFGNNGGLTQTFSISPASVARNSADNTHCPTLDQRNYARTDGQCDMGSFEFAGIPTAIRLNEFTTQPRTSIILIVSLVVLWFGVSGWMLNREWKF